MQATPELPGNIQQALATCTLVGHNLDFDLTVLRRYEIACSNSIVDTMLASRLLGLGKEKFKVPSAPDDDGDVEEVVNPTDHDLATVVRRYLGIKMDKAQTKLGRSDWGRLDLSPPHYHYTKEDVLHLPALWEPANSRRKGYSEAARRRATPICCGLLKQPDKHKRPRLSVTCTRPRFRVPLIRFGSSSSSAGSTPRVKCATIPGKAAK